MATVEVSKRQYCPTRAKENNRSELVAGSTLKSKLRPRRMVSGQPENHDKLIKTHILQNTEHPERKSYSTRQANHFGQDRAETICMLCDTVVNERQYYLWESQYTKSSFCSRCSDNNSGLRYISYWGTPSYVKGSWRKRHNAGRSIDIDLTPLLQVLDRIDRMDTSMGTVTPSSGNVLHKISEANERDNSRMDRYKRTAEEELTFRDNVDKDISNTEQSPRRYVLPQRALTRIVSTESENTSFDTTSLSRNGSESNGIEYYTENSICDEAEEVCPLEQTEICIPKEETNEENSNRLKYSIFESGLENDTIKRRSTAEEDHITAAMKIVEEKSTSPIQRTRRKSILSVRSSQELTSAYTEPMNSNGAPNMKRRKSVIFRICDSSSSDSGDDIEKASDYKDEKSKNESADLSSDIAYELENTSNETYNLPAVVVIKRDRAPIVSIETTKQLKTFETTCFDKSSLNKSNATVSSKEGSWNVKTDATKETKRDFEEIRQKMEGLSQRRHSMRRRSLQDISKGKFRSMYLHTTGRNNENNSSDSENDDSDSSYESMETLSCSTNTNNTNVCDNSGSYHTEDDSSSLEEVSELTKGSHNTSGFDESEDDRDEDISTTEQQSTSLDAFQKSSNVNERNDGHQTQNLCKCDGKWKSYSDVSSPESENNDPCVESQTILAARKLTNDSRKYCRSNLKRLPQVNNTGKWKTSLGFSTTSSDLSDDSCLKTDDDEHLQSKTEEIVNEEKPELWKNYKSSVDNNVRKKIRRRFSRVHSSNELGTAHQYRVSSGSWRDKVYGTKQEEESESESEKLDEQNDANNYIELDGDQKEENALNWRTRGYSVDFFMSRKSITGSEILDRYKTAISNRQKRNSRDEKVYVAKARRAKTSAISRIMTESTLTSGFTPRQSSGSRKGSLSAEQVQMAFQRAEECSKRTTERLKQQLAQAQF
ncbi:uncharacterized protein DDB_G0287625-like [Mya arenaria]|uniref:uncharacterized protein DDB_G0287625-like n=1 Tax=Mya arenaria TaxID=6604 RepID=UPI0022E168C2|nr:uncharacterized protein DDB_G0287625-like [Mya arenaria]